MRSSAIFCVLVACATLIAAVEVDEKKPSENALFQQVYKQISPEKPVAILSTEDVLRLLTAFSRPRQHVVILLSSITKGEEDTERPPCMVCNLVEKEYLDVARSYLLHLNDTSVGRPRPHDVLFLVSDVFDDRSLASFFYTVFEIPTEKFPLILYFKPQKHAMDNKIRELAKVAEYLDFNSSRHTFFPTTYVLEKMTKETEELDLTGAIATWLNDASNEKIKIVVPPRGQPSSGHRVLLWLFFLILGTAAAFAAYYLRRMVSSLMSNILGLGLKAWLAQPEVKRTAGFMLCVTIYFIAASGTVYDVLNNNVWYRKIAVIKRLVWVATGINTQYMLEGKVALALMCVMGFAFVQTTKIARAAPTEVEEEEDGAEPQSMSEKMAAVMQSMEKESASSTEKLKARVMLFVWSVLILFAWWVLTLMMKMKFPDYPFALVF